MWMRILILTVEAPQTMTSSDAIQVIFLSLQRRKWAHGCLPQAPPFGPCHPLVCQCCRRQEYSEWSQEPRKELACIR
jgi:hypothetical protein